MNSRSASNNRKNVSCQLEPDGSARRCETELSHVDQLSDSAPAVARQQIARHAPLVRLAPPPFYSRCEEPADDRETQREQRILPD
ncbi:MAG: hypothetical protein MHMPM18_003440 [Marteilia pararefringens]